MSELRLELASVGAEASADVGRRLIEGTVIPYGEPGVAFVDGSPREVVFRSGCLELARPSTPLVQGHDTEAPLGVLLELDDGPSSAVARFRVDATPAGDAALVQAASGSRAGLSAGALALKWTETASGALDVTAARLFHVGLVSIPAMPTALVSRVAATNGEGSTSAMSDMSPEEIAAAIGAETTDDELAELLEHDEETVRTAARAERDRRDAAAAGGDDEPDGQEALPTDAARGFRRTPERPVIHAGGTRGKRLACSGGELVLAMVAAQSGDRQAARMVEAVLSEISSADVPGLMPPAYTTDILGELPSSRPLADRVAVKRPLPATGMMFTKPKWATTPEGGWVAELAPTPSNEPALDTQDVTVLEWAYGVAMSYAVATRSSPDAIESIFRAAVADYYSDVEQKIADALMANDQPGTAGAGVGSAIAAFYGDEGQGPSLLVVSPDIYGDLVDVIDTVPTYSAGAVSGATLTGTIAGLEVVVSAHLPPGTELVTAAGVVELRETSPVRLTATVIGALKVELGVTAFAAIDVERPTAIHSLVPGAGTFSGSQARASKSKSKSDEG